MMQLAPMNLGTTVRRSCLVALSLVAACKGGGDSEKALTADVFGKVPAQPPAELGKLSQGMPVAEATKVAPHLIPKDKEDYDSFKSGYTGMRYAVGLSEDLATVERLRIELPKDSKALLVKAWGPGQDANCSSQPCTYWFDPGTGRRAVFETGPIGDEVEFSSYLPLDKLLGKTGTLGFETKSIVGLTIDELRKEYPAVFKEEPADPAKKREANQWIELPPTPYEMYWTRLGLQFEAGKVSRVFFDIPYRDFPAAKPELIAAIDKAWGPGLATTEITGDPRTTWFDPATGRRAELDATYDGNLQLELTPYLPLDKFLGEGADKLGWETTPLIGMTWADVSKAYPQYVATETDEEAAAKRKQLENFMGDDKDKLAALGEAKGGTSFTLPGTEYGSFTLIHLRYDDAGKIRQFAFDVPYGPNPAARDGIKAALEKKYGKATEKTEYGRTEYVLHAENPLVVAQDSDITKAWSIEVGVGP